MHQKYQSPLFSRISLKPEGEMETIFLSRNKRIVLAIDIMQLEMLKLVTDREWRLFTERK